MLTHWLVPFLVAIVALAGLFVALRARKRAIEGLKGVWEALDPMLSELARRETELSYLRNELDARIKRLLARELYWRDRALNAENPEKELPESPPVPEPESPLSLRQRLRGM